MKFIIDRPQQSDMGSGYGHIEGCEGISLKEVLAWIEENAHDWGVLTIFCADKMIRCFDYDVFNGHQFYHHLGWYYTSPVKEVKYDYCFMNKDIEIYI